MTGPAVMAGYKSGRIAAEFRGITPVQRDELVEALGDRIEISESPWLSNLLVSFNTKRAAVQRRAGAARAVARDRPVGRGGKAAELDLSQICRRRDAAGLEHGDAGSGAGHHPRVFARDIAASRDEAKRLLAEAGDPRPEADGHGARHPDAALRRRRSARRELAGIGVTTTQDRRNIWDWQKVIDSGEFDVALDFSGDFYDDPTIQLTKFVSHDLSPVNYSGSTDRFLDALYHRPGGDQRSAPAGEDRARFRATRLDRGLYGSAACGGTGSSQPRRQLKGWSITPSHFIGQDLTDVWLEH